MELKQNSNSNFRTYQTRCSVMSSIVDSIEANVETAAVHVEDGRDQLQKAKTYQVICYLIFDFNEVLKHWNLLIVPYACTGTPLIIFQISIGIIFEEFPLCNTR